jgi:uncharacterized caspase-like protein
MNCKVLFAACLFLFLAHARAPGQSEVFVEQAQSIPVFHTPILCGGLSVQSHRIAVLSSEKVLRVFEVPSLKESPTGLSAPPTTQTIAFSPSGKTLALGGSDGKISLLDISSGATGKSFAVHSQDVRALLYQDENTIFSAGKNWSFSNGTQRMVSLSDAANGSVVASLPGFAEDVVALALPSDAKNLAVGLPSGEVRIFSVGTRAAIGTLTDAKDMISALSYSPNGKFLAAGTTSGKVFLWNAQSGSLLSSYEQKGTIHSVVFDAASLRLASAGEDNSIQLFDVPLNARIKTIPIPAAYATFLAFLPDTSLLAGTNTGSIFRWTVSTVPPDTINPAIAIEHPSTQALAKAFGREFELQGVVYDDDRVKDVTINGNAAVMTAITKVDSPFVPAGIKSAKHFAAVLKLDSIGANEYDIAVSDFAKHTVHAKGEIQRLSSEQALEVENPANNSETGDISVALRFHPWFDVASYSVSVNMIDILSGEEPDPRATENVLSATVPLVSGYNQIQLSVTGKSGDRFSKTLGITRKTSILGASPPSFAGGSKKQRGTTSGPQRWAVVVGVSEYGNPNIPSLKYADKDAESIAGFLQRPEGGGFDSDHMRILVNKDATLANVKDALINFLNQAIDMDLVLIYFAGHGAPEPARPQNVYLLTYDSDPTALGTTAFPMWDIQTVLARYISAKRVIVFSDACHSGNINVNFATRGLGSAEQNPVNQYLADLSKSKEGVVVFTASASGEVSQEFPEMGHGAFTYYMLEGLAGKADYNNDYTVTINELMQYVEEQVKRKTHGAQNPTRSQTEYDKEMTISVIPH